MHIHNTPPLHIHRRGSYKRKEGKISKYCVSLVDTIECEVTWLYMAAQYTQTKKQSQKVR